MKSVNGGGPAGGIADDVNDVPVFPIAITDGEPPLLVDGFCTVFQEQGGADFKVEALSARVRATGDALTLHVASVRNAQTGAVCLAVRRCCGVVDVGSVEAEQFLLARHWRASLNAWCWELPRGMGAPGERAVETAIRELREEVGIAVSPDCVHIVQHMHADSGVLRDDIAVAMMLVDDVAADDYALCERVAGVDDANDWELRNAFWVDSRIVLKMIASGEITDGITLAALGVYGARQLR